MKLIFKPGQQVRVEHAAIIVEAVKDNPYWYVVEYAGGEHETVSIARLNLIDDVSKAVIDTDATIQVISRRLSPAGGLDLLKWLRTHEQELKEAAHGEEGGQESQEGGN